MLLLVPVVNTNLDHDKAIANTQKGIKSFDITQKTKQNKRIISNQNTLKYYVGKKLHMLMRLVFQEDENLLSEMINLRMC